MEGSYLNYQYLNQDDLFETIPIKRNIKNYTDEQDTEYRNLNSLTENSLQQKSDFSSYPNSIQKIKPPCLICQTPLTTDSIYLDSCSHFFCKPCLFEYLKIRIQESQVLTMPCPNDQCKSQILDSEIEKIASSALYTKYLRFKKVQELNKQPFIGWCPKPDCDGYDIGSLKRSKLECNVCKYEYCFYCGEAWHRSIKCKFSKDNEIDNWAKENGIKYCPNCKRKVEKLAGCEHLICPLCKYEWCWVCGEKFVLAHVCDATYGGIQTEFSMLRIIGMFFGPVILIFMGLIASVYYVYLVINKEFTINEKLESKILEYKKSSFLLAFILGVLLNPLIFLIVLFLASFDLIKLLSKKPQEGKKFKLFLSALVFPILVVITICFYILCPIIGMLLLLKRFYTAFRVWRNPRYLTIVNKYGYY